MIPVVRSLTTFLFLFARFYGVPVAYKVGLRLRHICIECLMYCWTEIKVPDQHFMCSQYRLMLCFDNSTCCHSETEVADQTCYVIQPVLEVTIHRQVPAASALEYHCVVTGLWGKTMRCVYNTGYAADLSVGEDDEMCV